MVGARYAQSDKGAVYIYVRSGLNWVLQQKLTAFDGVSGDLYGEAVAVLGDVVVVGAQEKSTTLERSICTIVLTRNGPSDKTDSVRWYI